MGVLNIEETFNEMAECERDWSNRIRFRYIISAYSTEIRKRLGFDDSDVHINKNIKGKPTYVVHDKFLAWIDKNHMYKDLDNMIETVNSEHGVNVTSVAMMNAMLELCMEADNNPKNIIL